MQLLQKRVLTVKVVAAGANPVLITRGIEKTTNALVSELISMSKEVEDSELADVAAVSAGNNPKVVNMIAEALSKVSRKGVLTLKRGKGWKTVFMLLKACSLIVAISPLILLPILRKWLLSMRTASYWWWIKKITNARDLINVLEDAIRGGYPILIIAEVIEQEALGTLVVNKLRGALKVAALKARKFGERKSQYLDDIGILTEGEDVYEETEGADQ